MFFKLMAGLLVLAVQTPGPVLSGRIVFDATSAKPPADLTRVYIVFARPEDSGVLVKLNVGLVERTALPGGSVGADGRFSVQGLKPGTYFVSTLFLPAQWRLRSAIYEGTDVAEAGFPVSLRGVGGTGELVLTFTDRSTAISGAVRMADGTEPAAVTVLAFPQNRLMWGWSSSRTKVAKLGPDFRYVVRDLPPGRYLVAAVTGYTAKQNTAEYWEKLSTTAVAVVLGDGDQRVVDLTVGK
ncbi:MAG TPA: hypothetical protein VN700_03700 [Vicinamibacterales bacterium]|nr:hypothetical protein [Vicinamibacterales bacterium]